METTSYLSFTLGNEHFASPVSKVINILEMCQITKVPLAPDYMVGVINLRGSVLPLIDTRIKFNLTPTEITQNTCILVLDITYENERVFVGALVDSVQEVFEINSKDIQAPPSIGAKFKTDDIAGVAHINNKFVMILNMDRLFAISGSAILMASEIAHTTTHVTEDYT